MDERLNEIKKIWQEWKILYIITGYLIGIITYPAFTLVTKDLAELLGGLVPEAFGIAFTVILIDRIYRIRDEQRETRELYRRLMREAGSRDNSTAVSAIDYLRNEMLLTGKNSLLREANLYRANLSNANFGENANLANSKMVGVELIGALLYQADLSNSVMRQSNLTEVYLREAVLIGVDLTFADMTGANLKEANLQDAQLSYVRLQGAKIWGANLDNCNLQGADLQNANLYPCNLCGANLEAANLTNADLRGVEFDRSTIMPDGSYWDESLDIEKFTNPNHSEYVDYNSRDLILRSLQSL